MQEMGWEHRLHRPAVLFDVVNLSPGVWFVTTVTIRMEFMKVLRLCGCVLFMLAAGVAAGEEPVSPAPQIRLEPILKIDWAPGTDLPQGFQDSDGGVIGRTLVTACGFCSGGLEEDNRQKPGRYPRGFLKKVWGIDLDKVATQWNPLPEFPGAARQGLFSAKVGDALYLWGGFSYDEPYCFNDGWKLSRNEKGEWSWTALPTLPWLLNSAAACAIGTKVYVIGGADYDGVTGFFTEADRHGKHRRLGARLLILDTSNPEAGWVEGPECPGTARFVHTVQAVNERVFVLGGATGDVVREGTRYGYCTVVDNWMFDPSTATWTRLRDLPVSSGNFPKSTNLVFNNRWIVLPGGHQYTWVMGPDGALREKYGAASQKRPESGLHNDVFVYDTATNRFGTADKLPIDNNLPMSVVDGDKIYLMGGETGGGMIDGEYFGHHPDLFLVGDISMARSTDSGEK